MTAPISLLAYDPADWYWRVATRPGEVYHSARFAFVPDTDAAFLAWVAADFPPTAIVDEGELREVLSAAGVVYLAEPLPPIEEDRPRVQRARLRLRVQGVSLASSITGALIQWAAAGAVDPLGMWNAGQADRIVIPAGQGGVYLAQVAGVFALNANGDRALQMRRGANPIPGATLSGRAPALRPAETFGSRLVVLAAGDIFRVGWAQDSGGPLVCDAEVALMRVE